MRIAFVAGPGDSVGSFNFWQSGRHDGRTPVISYSTQFFQTVTLIDADALVVTEGAEQPDIPSERIAFLHIPRRRDTRGSKYWLSELRYGHQVATEVSRWKPDFVILSGDLAISAYTQLAARFPTFLTVHNTFWSMGLSPDNLSGRVKTMIWQVAFRSVRGAVCISKECKRQLELLMQPRDVRIEVVTPQIVSTHLRPRIDRRSARSFLYAGRIDRVKGIFDLLEAFRASAAGVDGATLRFAGDGNDRELLRSRLAAYDGPGTVEFLGRLDAAMMHKAFSEHDVLVCPTRSEFKEGLAKVVLEAAAHGLPSIVSSVVPAAEYSNGSSLVFPANDASALRERMSALMADDQLYSTLSDRAYGVRAYVLNRALSWGSHLLTAFAHDLAGASPSVSKAAR